MVESDDSNQAKQAASANGHDLAQAAQAHLDVVYPPKKSAQAAQDAEQEEAEED